MKKCCICGKYINGYGNNPYPYGKKDDDECCNACNERYVVPARLRIFLESKRSQGGTK